MFNVSTGKWEAIISQPRKASYKWDGYWEKLTQRTVFVKWWNMLLSRVAELFLRRIFIMFLSGMVVACLTCPEESGCASGTSGHTFGSTVSRTKTSEMHFLSRLAKWNEVFNTVISYLEVKVVILSKFIEAYGFTIPEKLLFLLLFPVLSYEQNWYKHFNFAFVTELAWQLKEALAFSG